ncbi:dephospho-CoA kinase [uncultured Georgenia sp.]|uniref:dephospho-CoA kinase n=1 Tax=uncultured Georgenia sp. TaxID=378209 RepID=UPI00261ACE9B|nr:dephospho-CoA kinase [uncultured Georgenia sp.]HLV02991.1 dephospho-CoA kinase [Actinomycetaceae bacterium]
MLRIGLTGGIGAGKSTVARELERLGAVVIDADALAREVVAPGTAGLRAVAAEFGDGVLTPDGTLDRAALSRVVFADPHARARLEAITHPLIAVETARRLTDLPEDAVVVHDVPLIVEKGLAGDYDLVVVVGADEEVRLDRLVRDRGMSRQDALARIRAQATDEERRAVADVWLDNSGTPEELLAQVRELWRERLAPAAGRTS